MSMYGIKLIKQSKFFIRHKVFVLVCLMMMASICVNTISQVSCGSTASSQLGSWKDFSHFGRMKIM